MQVDYVSENFATISLSKLELEGAWKDLMAGFKRMESLSSSEPFVSKKI